MQALGVSKEGTALLRKEKNRIIIERLERDVKPLDIHTVTGLETFQVVRRDLSLKVKREKEILAVLPFQVENLIPFPMEETVLQPQIFPNGEVVLFATKKKFIESHLQQRATDQISCEPQALYRWASWRFPGQKNLCVLGRTTCVVIEGSKIVFAQGFEEKERMVAYVKAKHPNTFMVEEEEFSIPIGLAIEGLLKNGLHFHTPPKQIRKKILQHRGYIAVALGLALLTFTIGAFKIASQERAIQETLSKLSAPSNNSVIARVELFEKSLVAPPQLIPSAPLVSEFLAWISRVKEEIDITHLHYTLVNQNCAKIDLEFKAPSPSTARTFHELLQSGAFRVDTAQEITWNLTQEKYKTTFYIK